MYMSDLFGGCRSSRGLEAIGCAEATLSLEVNIDRGDFGLGGRLAML